MVGLGSVDNTADSAKPVSTAQQTALNAKVTGAASSTDNAIAIFNGITGKIVQNSSAIVSDDGYLGINTVPEADFHVASENRVAIWAVGGELETSHANLLFGEGNTSGKYGGLFRLANLNGANGGNLVVYNRAKPLAFSTANLFSSVYHLFIDTSGNIGVNTSTPTDRLDVNGSARFRGAIKDSTGSAGTNGQVLKNVAGLPVWSNP
jgi:hypothetical protein